MLLTIIGWLGLLAFLGIAAASGMQAVRFGRAGSKQHASWSASACAASVCLTVCFAAVAGRLTPVAGAILGTVTALAALAVMWEDARQPLGEDGTRGLLRAAGDAAIAAAWAVGSVFHRDSTEDGGELPDNVQVLDDHRPSKAEALPAAAPDALPPPPPPATNGRTPAVTMPPPAAPAGSIGTGTAADLFAGFQAAIMRGKSKGMPGNHETVKMFAEVYDYLRQHADSFAQYMMEQGQYAAAVWEPLTTMAGHSRAAVGAASQSDTALTALARMTVGDVAVNPAVRAPHHGELNAAQ